MALIDDAIADLESQEPGKQLILAEFARKWGVSRATLSRRWRRVTGPRRDGYAQQQAISPQQELELVRYIKGLTKRGLPPTREMIRNFSSEVVHQQLSESWVTRFINRHKIHLISKWTTAMDRTRHLADSESKYRLYFELLHQKISEYHLEARDIYNMDEKGLIGLIGRSKRIFSRRQWEKKEVRVSLQDGSREFLTVMACCCADGSSLPPALYAAKKGAIQSSWVEDIKAGEHEVFVSSSPTGWSNDNVSDHDWRKLDRLVRAAFNDSHQYEARKLRSSVHHISVQYELLQLENEGLKEALQHKKKHKKKGKALDLQQRQEYHGGAVHWSPRKLREARAREVVRERDEAEEKLQKAQARKQREEAQLQRQVELEQRRVERQRLKEMREQEREAAERARKVSMKLNTRQKLSNKLNNASAKPHE
ncbi:hypothetical protein P3342_004685 [Pyrenophora teres f. teres]|nr:hypothetical protein P3342_004685 [Pyrenophora teres f. teres]